MAGELVRESVRVGNCGVRAQKNGSLAAAVKF
jgi:hypothetical protein